MKNNYSTLILAVAEFRIIYGLVTYKNKSPEELRSSELKSPPDCIIWQEKEGLKAPPVPAFLKSHDLQPCRTKYKQTSDGAQNLRCKNSDSFILPKCVCGFHQVWEAMYHGTSVCTDNSDNIKNLTCSDCRNFSLGNNGPCINGGKLKCKNDNDLAVNSQCECPENYKGMFCEHKVEKVSRPCRKIDQKEVSALPKCEYTAQRCVTQNLEQTMWFECEKETMITQVLPNCTIMPITTAVQPSNTKEPSTTTTGSPTLDIHPSSNACRHSSTLLILFSTYFHIISQT